MTNSAMLLYSLKADVYPSIVAASTYLAALTCGGKNISLVSSKFSSACLVPATNIGTSSDKVFLTRGIRVGKNISEEIFFDFFSLEISSGAEVTLIGWPILLIVSDMFSGTIIGFSDVISTKTESSNV